MINITPSPEEISPEFYRTGFGFQAENVMEVILGQPDARGLEQQEAEVIARDGSDYAYGNTFGVRVDTPFVSSQPAATNTVELN